MSAFSKYCFWTWPSTITGEMAGPKRGCPPRKSWNCWKTGSIRYGLDASVDAGWFVEQAETINATKQINKIPWLRKRFFLIKPIIKKILACRQANYLIWYEWHPHSCILCEMISLVPRTIID